MRKRTYTHMPPFKAITWTQNKPKSQSKMKLEMDVFANAADKRFEWQSIWCLFSADYCNTYCNCTAFSHSVGFFLFCLNSNPNYLQILLPIYKRKKKTIHEKGKFTLFILCYQNLLTFYYYEHKKFKWEEVLLQNRVIFLSVNHLSSAYEMLRVI